MKSQPKMLQQRMHHFKEQLKNAGVKLTYQRTEIFREVAISEDHPDAEKIYKSVR